MKLTAGWSLKSQTDSFPESQFSRSKTCMKANGGTGVEFVARETCLESGEIQATNDKYLSKSAIDTIVDRYKFLDAWNTFSGYKPISAVFCKKTSFLVPSSLACVADCSGLCGSLLACVVLFWPVWFCACLCG